MMRVAICLAVAAWLIAPVSSIAADPEQLLGNTRVAGGLVVQIGCDECDLLLDLARRSGFLVQGLSTSSEEVIRGRERLQAAGPGGKASIREFDGEHLPYIDNLVNLLIVRGGETDGRTPVWPLPQAEIRRVLAPEGSAVLLDSSGAILESWKKPRPDTIDEWPQYLYEPGGNAVGNDREVGPLRHLQWEAGPRWTRSHENLSSVPAVVASGGRVFAIIDEGPAASMWLPSQWTLIARDAFSGVELWRRPMESWQSSLYPLKLGPFQLPRRLVAWGDRVYVTLGVGEPVSELDAATGRLLRVFGGTEGAEEIVHCGDRLLVLMDDQKSPQPYTDRKRVPDGWKRPEITVRVTSDRSVAMIDVASGEIVWRVHAGNVTPLTPAVSGDRVFYHAVSQIVCLDAATGERIWQVPIEKPVQYTANFGPALVVHDGVVCFATDRSVSGYDVSDGRRLWKVDGMVSRCLAPISIHVIDDIVWVPRAEAWNTNSGFKQPDGELIGYDLRTGKVVRRWAFDASLDIGVMHHRCCMPKATAGYVVPSWPGIEMIDTRTGNMYAHHWVRGACLFGTMPAYGMFYAPPNPCECYPSGRLTGFLALAPARRSEPKSNKESGFALSSLAGRTERGPAFGVPLAMDDAASSDLWRPTHRHDVLRSGAGCRVEAEDLHAVWNVTLGGKLTQPIVADHKVFTVSVDEGKVIALDSQSGRKQWEFTAGSRVDSSPTFWRGRLLFGCRDGYVYCLDADSGTMCWRFLAAPEDRQLVSYDRLESVWPVPGNVLVLEGVAWFVAGRSSYVDGGMRVYRVDAETGKLLSATPIYLIDEEGRQPRVGPGYLRRLEMPGALPDVLSSDGRFVYLRHLAFDREGRLLDGSGNVHLVCAGGFLDDSWFHRVVWTWGVGPINPRTGVAMGQGGGARIMAVGDDRLFFYGRLNAIPRNQGFSEPFYLSCTDRSDDLPSEEILSKRGFSSGSVNAAVTDTIWSVAWPLHVRAMVLAGDVLWLAGPKGDWKVDPAVYSGRRGTVLQAVSSTSGEVTAEMPLPSAPVFDGMAAAQGRLFIVLEDGSLLCVGRNGSP
ncbi:hypothetical protein JCM19992_22130 [Thermostilla marina]